MVTVWVEGILCLLLQVTEKLMQAEEKKLKVLKSEIEAGRHSDSAASSAKVHTLRTGLNEYCYVVVMSYTLFNEP